MTWLHRKEGGFVTGTERFDLAAATWDLSDRRVQIAQAVAAGISSRLSLPQAWNVLDFGCGTGLLTLALAPQVASITGADTSPGMLQTLATKAETQGVPVTLQALDLAVSRNLGGPYHLIVSSMTLHHIGDVPALFSRFSESLLPGGALALADLEQEDGSFHEDATGVYHHGFAGEQVQTWLEEAGFQQVRVETITVTHKSDRDYPIFLVTAAKP
jgi:predicted TPR repeat methyltransferase